MRKIPPKFSEKATSPVVASFHYLLCVLFISLSAHTVSLKRLVTSNQHKCGSKPKGYCSTTYVN